MRPPFWQSPYTTKTGCSIDSKLDTYTHLLDRYGNFTLELRYMDESISKRGKFENHPQNPNSSPIHLISIQYVNGLVKRGDGLVLSWGHVF